MLLRDAIETAIRAERQLIHCRLALALSAHKYNGLCFRVSADILPDIIANKEKAVAVVLISFYRQRPAASSGAGLAGIKTYKDI